MPDLELDSHVVVDRRICNRRIRNNNSDRRQKEQPPAVERRKVERRRLIDPTTCERDYTQDEVEFMRAMDEYKRKSGRMFPTWSEVLEVLRGLGYAKLNQPVPTSALN